MNGKIKRRGKYDSGDENTRTLLQQAFSAATKLFGIAVSREVDIELKEASGNSGDAFKIFHEIANAEISKLIVGQTLSSTASPTGMNSGVADLQGDVREDLRQFDAIMLIETLQDQLINQLLEVNGLDGNVQLMWGSASINELKSKMSLLKDLKEAGFTPDDDAMATISKTIGFNIIRNSNPQQPSVIPMSADSLFYRRKR